MRAPEKPTHRALRRARIKHNRIRRSRLYGGMSALRWDQLDEGLQAFCAGKRVVRAKLAPGVRWRALRFSCAAY